jgi:hypothetical protein
MPKPVGAGLSHAVQCPVCGGDGTLAANQSIAEYLAVDPGRASGLRIGGQQLPAGIPLPRRIPAAVPRERNSLGVKVRKKRPILVLGGVAAALLVLASAVMFGRGSDRKQEPAPSSAAADQGLPSTLDALNAWYTEPSLGQNAATYYVQGFSSSWPLAEHHFQTD